MEWEENVKEIEVECGCSIKIEDSIVVVICAGEIEIEKLRHYLRSAAEVKSNARMGS
ncbi:MAG: hypothetical protein PHO01_01720 [Desulfotomaculaceae bacterium]|nr:hypothetical protein [Desulfotomaculaceae bacterium]